MNKLLRRLNLSVGAKPFQSPSIDAWLQNLPQKDGIYQLSGHSAYQHAEDDYDAQYNNTHAKIDERVGRLLIDTFERPPEAVLEVACGSGYLTGSLLLDPRVKTLVASDASHRFLAITKNKLSPINHSNKLKLVTLSDDDFSKIPGGAFDAIVMRSALHHFVDFKGTAVLLIEKLKAGGALYMLEPRADFHIVSTLALKAAQSRLMGSSKWTDAHAKAVTDFADTATFYLNRTRDKRAAEDKYVFHYEELLDIANSANSSLVCIGAEAGGNFSQRFREFLHFCMNNELAIVDDLMDAASDEISFLNESYASFPRYGAAEWFAFRKHD